MRTRSLRALPAIDAAKTVMPARQGVVERPRLVERLAGAGAHAVWFNAPSGTGKSTLAACYAAGTGRTVVWYRLDERDDDPAFFYARFAAAFSRSSGSRRALPRFAPDDDGRESTFADRFLAALRSGRTRGLLFVFDDAHRIGRTARLEALARFAVHADDLLKVLFVAEQPAPEPYFDAIAARRLALCDDLPLAFDAAECAALAGGSRSARADGAQLAALTGGHAGALVLAREFLRGEGAVSAGEERIVERIHLHLLERLIGRLLPARRALLERTAFAPQITPALAEALAGPEAAAELEPLAACGLLRRIAHAGEPVYEAHGLVRRGLLALLRSALDSEQVHARALETAHALVAQGADEDAFALLAEAAMHEEAAAVLERLAQRYAREGQAHLVARAAAALPARFAERRPLLCFWVGQALLGVDEETARGWFERSFAAFERAGDRSGMRLAAACVVTAYGLEYGDLRGLDAWLERHARAGGDGSIEAGAPHEAALGLGVVCAAIARGAYPPGFDAHALVRRLRILIDDPQAWITPDQPAEAARLLIDHARIFGSNEQAQALVTATRARVETPACGALQRGRWCISAALAHFEVGGHAAAAHYLARARQLAASTGSPRLRFELGTAEIDAALKRGDVDAAAAHLAALEPLAATAPPAQRAEHARFTARVLLLQGRTAEGLRWAQDALDTAEAAGYTGDHARAFQVELINALAANGRYDDALARSDAFWKRPDGQRRAIGAVLDGCLRFLAAGGRDADALRDGIERAARAGFVNLLARAPAAVAVLCERALARGIEPEFVRRVVAFQRLDPPVGAGPAWPWLVRIRTLGAFELEVRGERYRPSHKAQEKPLELVKLLVTAQALGRDSVDKAWVTGRLWPDADSANARKSLDMTISRLRRLLGDDAALLAPEGRLQLAPARVWTDVRPFLRALERVGVHRDARAAGREAAFDAALADLAEVLDHYRGPFLPDEDPPPWLLAGRAAVAAAVRTALVTADAVLAGRADARLVPALERAFVADPASEDLARALMRALARAGRHGEALIVYRRVREMLSIVLGVRPARETELLKDEIQAAAQAGGAGPEPPPPAAASRPR